MGKGKKGSGKKGKGGGAVNVGFDDFTIDTVVDVYHMAVEGTSYLVDQVGTRINAQMESDMEYARLAQMRLITQAELDIEFAKSAYNIALKQMETAGETYVAASQSMIETVSKSLVDTISTMSTSMIERATAQRKAEIDIKTEAKKTDFSQQVKEYEGNRDIDIQMQRAWNAEIHKGMVMLGAGKIGNIFGDEVLLALDQGKKLNEEQLDILKQGYEEMINQEKNFMDKRIDLEQKLAAQNVSLAQKIQETALSVEKAGEAIGYSIGIAFGDVKRFRQGLSSVARDIAFLNKDESDIQTFSTQYAEATGRGMGMSTTDLTNVFAMAQMVGQENVNSIANAMNIFNRSAEDTSKTIFTVYQHANRMGLSGKKVTKDIANNMKLANQYNFRGGAEGLMRMSIWAEKTRFNMQDLGNMIEKTTGSGLENLITQSAKFNVLGGAAAAMSDPFGMGYEALADPQAFAKRMQAMTTGFGTWDKETGQMNFSVEEALRIKAIADVQGRSVESLRNEIQDREKRNRVENVIGGRNVYGDKTDAVTSKSFYDQATKSWKINILGADGQYEKKDVRNLTPEDLKSLAPDVEPQEQLVDIARQILNLMSQGEAQGKEQIHTLATEEYDTVVRNYEDMMNQRREDFDAKIDDYLHRADLGFGLMMEAQTQTMALYDDMREELERMNVSADAKEITTSVKELVKKADKFVTDMNTNIGLALESNQEVVDATEHAKGANVVEDRTKMVDEGQGIVNENKPQIQDRRKEIIVETQKPYGAVGEAAGKVFATADRAAQAPTDLQFYMWFRNKYPQFTESLSSHSGDIQTTNDFRYSGGPSLILTADRAYQTHPDDVVTAAKKGGVMDRITKEQGEGNLNASRRKEFADIADMLAQRVTAMEAFYNPSSYAERVVAESTGGGSTDSDDRRPIQSSVARKTVGDNLRGERMSVEEVLRKVEDRETLREIAREVERPMATPTKSAFSQYKDMIVKETATTKEVMEKITRGAVGDLNGRGFDGATIRVAVDGRIVLENNGMSFDITEEMRRNKTFIHEITNQIFNYKDTSRLSFMS